MEKFIILFLDKKIIYQPTRTIDCIVLGPIAVLLSLGFFFTVQLVNIIK